MKASLLLVGTILSDESKSKRWKLLSILAGTIPSYQSKANRRMLSYWLAHVFPTNQKQKRWKLISYWLAHVFPTNQKMKEESFFPIGWHNSFRPIKRWKKKAAFLLAGTIPSDQSKSNRSKLLSYWLAHVFQTNQMMKEESCFPIGWHNSFQPIKSQKMKAAFLLAFLFPIVK